MWRNPSKRENPTRPREEQEQEWLEKLEETIERLRKEDKARAEARIVNEKRRQELREQNKIKQEEILRKSQEKAERKTKQRILERR